MQIMRKPGFTLAELVVVFTVLSIIASFSLGKLIAAHQLSMKKAIIKETIASLSQILYQGVIANEITNVNMKDYVFNRLSAIKLCPSQSLAQGCWTQALDGYPSAWAHNEPGFVLANGATVAGVVAVSDWYEEIHIDWNGASPPNLEGEDQIGLVLCYGSGCSGGGKPSQVYAWPGRPKSELLYKEIFTQ